jgi:hypothetical protein
MPVFATYFMIMALSSMGLPLLNGFIGEFTILQGAFAKNFWWAFFAAIGIVLGAAYLLWLYQRLFFGEITNPANAKLPDLTFREQLTLLPLVILALWIGLYPAPIFRVIRRPSEKIVQIVGGATAEAPAMAEKAASAPDASGGRRRASMTFAVKASDWALLSPGDLPLGGGIAHARDLRPRRKREGRSSSAISRRSRSSSRESWSSSWRCAGSRRRRSSAARSSWTTSPCSSRDSSCCRSCSRSWPP